MKHNNKDKRMTIEELKLVQTLSDKIHKLNEIVCKNYVRIEELEKRVEKVESFSHREEDVML